MKKLTTILVICLLLLATVPMPVAASYVTPETIVDTLKAGDTERDTVNVNLPATAPKGDVVFLFDATGSMSGQIGAMKAKAGTIMTQVRGAVPDTNFGIGSIVDYPGYFSTAGDGYHNYYGYASSGDYAWKMDQDLTTDTAVFQTQLAALHTYNGGDGPQDYTRGLYEAQFFNWRSDAKKIVVIFGDNMPHSYPSGASVFGTGHTYGADPGRDEIIGTADDLDFVPVVQQLAAKGIVVISVDCSGGSATTFYQYIADQTGGSRFVYTSSTIGDDIVAKINAATSAPIKEMKIVVREDTYAPWVATTPSAFYNIPWGESRTFDVTVTPPADTPSGTITIHLDVYGDGVLIGTTTITKTIEGSTPVPEFPTLALPVGMILGVMFLAFSVRSRKEE